MKLVTIILFNLFMAASVFAQSSVTNATCPNGQVNPNPNSNVSCNSSASPTIPALVQTICSANTVGTSGNTGSCSSSTNIVAGHTIVLSMIINTTGTAPVYSVSDTKNNTWVVQITSTIDCINGGNYVGIATAYITTGGADTISGATMGAGLGIVSTIK